MSADPASAPVTSVIVETLYLEDIEPGSTLVSAWYTVEREEIIRFASEWDPYDFHLDDAAAERSVFGGLAACAAHIFAISTRLAHSLPARLALVAGLGGDGLELLAPLRAGERVRLVRRFTATRASRSRPTAGVVTIEDSLQTPAGETLFRTSGSMLIARRSREG